MATFQDNIRNLQKIYLDGDYDTNQKFWSIMNSISDEDTYRWALYIIKSKHLTSTYEISGKEWAKLTDMLSQYLNTKKFSDKQKRYCIIKITQYWDYLEMTYCF
jgi:hypothetical protein